MPGEPTNLWLKVAQENPALTRPEERAVLNRLWQHEKPFVETHPVNRFRKRKATPKQRGMQPAVRCEVARLLLQEKPEYAALREKLFLSKIGFVVSRASALAGPDHPSFNEVVSAGVFGLAEALDEGKKTWLSYFNNKLKERVDKEIEKELQNQRVGAIRTPTCKKGGIRRRVERCRDKLAAMGIPTTLEQIAIHSGISTSRINRLFSEEKSRSAASDVVSLEELGEKVADAHGETNAMALELIMENHVFSRLKGDSRAKRIIKMKFGIGGETPLTYDEIRKELRISKARAQQIVAKALARIPEHEKERIGFLVRRFVLNRG